MTSEQQRVAAIKKVLPAVVSIAALAKLSDIEKKRPQMVFPVFERDRSKTNSLLKKITGNDLNVSGGSGFIVDPSGIVVTNVHVILEGELNYRVTMNDGTTHAAKLLTRDVISDVAFLKIVSEKKQKFPALKLGNSGAVEIGQNVLAVGNALGLFRNTVSCGIVSGLARSIEAGNDSMKENLHGLIQTDAAINPGNSGGPLINMKGEAVGINAASVFEAENIGFAIPINTAKRDLDYLKKYGEIVRPFLGVRYLIIDDRIRGLFNLPAVNGIVVASPYPRQEAIVPRSPAARAGIKEHDIITALNDTPLTRDFTLQDFLNDATIGQHVSIKVLRNNKPLTLKVVLEKR